MNRQSTPPIGFCNWHLGAPVQMDSGAMVEVFDGEHVIARVVGVDAADAQRLASVFAIAPSMYRALAATAVCLEQFSYSPEQLARTVGDESRQ